MRHCLQMTTMSSSIEPGVEGWTTWQPAATCSWWSANSRRSVVTIVLLPKHGTYAWRAQEAIGWLLLGTMSFHDFLVQQCQQLAAYFS